MNKAFHPPRTKSDQGHSAEPAKRKENNDILNDHGRYEKPDNKRIYHAAVKAFKRVLSTELKWSPVIGFLMSTGRTIGNLLNNLWQALVRLWLYLKVAVIVSALTSFIFVSYLYHNIFITVPAGHAAVKWMRFQSGTVMGRTYGEGLHIIFPWNRLYVYDLRLQQVKPETNLYTRDGLFLTVESSLRYHPIHGKLPELHRRIGKDYKDKLLLPELTSALRKVIGNYSIAEVYALDEQGLLEEVNRVIREDVVDKYVLIDDLLITRLVFPEVVQESIQNKLIQEQRALAYTYILARERDEAKRRVIEARGIKQFESESGISILVWRGIEATESIAKSENAKIVIMGNDKESLPVLLNTNVP